MDKKYFAILALSAVFSGCAYKTDPQISMTPPVYVEELPEKKMGENIQNQGSLFGGGNNPIFSDRKAMNVNDLVTIVIRENTNQTSKGNKSTKEDSTTSLQGGVMNTGEGLANVANTFNKYANIGFKGGSANAYSADGSNSRSDSFNTTISARIVKVLNNGNYFIEGNRELLINGEKQIIQLSGVIRPYDISNNNEIDSRYIADAKILYKTQGDINEATTKPWGTKLIQSIWPF